MLRRTAVALLTVIALAAGRAEAVTIRDVIELSKAGLSDQVLLALIEVDRGVFTMDAPTLKQLKTAGVSDTVILALIRSGRPAAQEPEPTPEPVAAPEPEVIVRYVDRYVDRYPDYYQPPVPAPAPVAVPYPVAVPVYVPLPTRRSFGRTTSEREVTMTFPTDIGLVKARLPIPANCVKAEPVYWGFGGKLRPDAWQPPPTVVCSR